MEKSNISGSSPTSMLRTTSSLAMSITSTRSLLLAITKTWLRSAESFMSRGRSPVAMVLTTWKLLPSSTVTALSFSLLTNR